MSGTSAQRLPAVIGRRLDFHRVMTVVVALEILAIVVLAAITVRQFQVFGIDEGAHLSYIEVVADHGRLPQLGRDPSAWQAQAIDQGTYPRHSPIPASKAGLAGENYEACQPPLYYVLAAPVYLLRSNFISKLRAVRAFDAMLLLIGVGLLGLLARAVFERRWLLPYAMALSVVMWPGVLIRTISVSYEALALPLALGFVLVCWHAAKRRSGRWLLAASGLFGLCLLTTLTLVSLGALLLIPIVALLRDRHNRRPVAAAVVSLLLPVVMLAPWLALNESRYHALTGQRIIKQEQTAEINPTHHHYVLWDVISAVRSTNRAVLPEEWWVQQYRPTATSWILRGIFWALLLAAVGGMLWRLRQPRAGPWAGVLLLGAPWVLGIVVLGVGMLIVQWPMLFPRYLNPEYVLLGLIAVPATTGERGRWASLAAVAAITLTVAAVWGHVAFAYM